MKRYKKFAIILGVLIVVALVALKTPLLLVKKVDVTAKGFCVTPDQVTQTAHISNSYLFMVRPNQIKQKLLTQYPCLEDVNIHWKWLNTIQIEAIQRVGVVTLLKVKDQSMADIQSLEASPSTGTALIKWDTPDTTGQPLTVDKDGVIFGKADNSSLPLLYDQDPDHKGEFKLGERLNFSQFADIVQIINKLQELSLPVQTAVWEDQYLLVLKPQKIAFSLNNVDRSLASLQLILQKAKIDGKPMDSIDLRFDKPVVVFSQQQGRK